MSKIDPPQLIGREASSLFGKSPYEKWPRVETLPYLPSVLVHFWGLMGFSYEDGPDGTHCEIGIHKNEISDPRMHKLELCTFENGQPTGYFNNFNDGMYFTLRIDGRDPDVKFFMPGKFHRNDKQTSNPHDFRWLIDLEAKDFYDKKLSPLTANVYTKRIRVRNGTFVTHYCPDIKFEVVGGPNQMDYIYLAHIISAQYELQEHETFLLEMSDGFTLPFPKKQGTVHEIHFANVCYKDGEPCKESDFDLNFELTNIPPNQRFTLRPTEGLDTSVRDQSPNICSWQQLDHPMKAFVSDESPCMGAGYGQGPLPDFPPG